jgi:hypothetical protein
MYCAGCGQIVSNAKVCPQCGQPLAALAAGAPGEAAEVYVFARTLRRLRQFWFLFACLNVALGVAGVVMVQFGVSHQAGPWEPWPHPPLLEWLYIGGWAWTLLIVRLALAAAASLGLRDRTAWARLVTGLAAVMAFTQFPIGLLLGAYTLVKIMGPRNRELFGRFTVRRSQ